MDDTYIINVVHNIFAQMVMKMIFKDLRKLIEP